MSQRLIAILMKQTQQMMQARQPVSDVALLHQFATERDERAFAGLIQRHGPMVWAVCRNSLRCESDAEDAFQATFLALVRKAHRIRSRFTVGAWLHGVAVRVCLKARQSATRRLRRETKAALKNHAITNDGIWNDELTRVHEQIRRLPQRELEVFVLCALEGLPQLEVAKRFGLKLGSVSCLLARARKRLQARLRSDDSKSLLALTVAVCSPVMVPAALLSQTCSLARSTAGLSASILSLATSVMEVPMRKLMILTVCALFVTSGFTIRTFLIGTVEGQERPQPNSGVVAQEPATTITQPANIRGRFVENSPAANKWEYKTLRCSAGSLEPEANGLGNAGWELCSMSPGSESSHFVCIFKRPKSTHVLSVETKPAFHEASLAENPPPAVKYSTALSEYLVFHLKKANAQSVAETLKLSLSNVVCDPRTNSVHVQCPKADADKIRFLIETLDTSAKQN